ncbi:MAG: hypothetical protein R3E08_12050 [Thiotrichaceae bacterium]
MSRILGAHFIEKDIAHRSHAAAEPLTNQHLEEGNSLLASMGRSGKISSICY